MAAALKILFVHGVGDQHTSLAWQDQWRDVVTEAIHKTNPNREVICDFCMYDDIIAEHPMNAGVIAGAFAKLAGSGIYYGVSDLAHKIGDTVYGWFHPASRGLGDVPYVLRWTAGMVAQWADDAGLRTDTRARLRKSIQEFQPDVVAAHSLGSLVAYDLFRHDSATIRGKTFITFGSQIGNAFVRGTFGGAIPAIPASRWFHLYNPNDHAFASPLNIPDSDTFDFTQVDATFDIPNDVLNHDGTHYLANQNVAACVWPALAFPESAPQSRAFERQISSLKAAARKPHTRRRNTRALLIGINDYPDPANRLEGCVNDVFLMSSLLQEAEDPFAPEDIRVVLNDRATAAGILERLHWLLDGVQPGDRRFLFYSGHGAQIPAYGSNEEVDHIDECLVPYDFDWTPEHAIIDKQILQLYAQLPFRSEFLAVFDCCHAGGIDRFGGKPRGLSPPDDIRHRALRWSRDDQMWLPRKLPMAQEKKDKDDEAYVGKSGAVNRFLRAVPLRRVPDSAFRSVEPARPFLPVILEACQEDQLSYEYRDGATPYGAFTFSLAASLRTAKKRLTFTGLKGEIDRRLGDLGYQQNPCVIGPKSVINKAVPWRHVDVGAKPRRR
jgi:hypothetical protein